MSCLGGIISAILAKTKWQGRLVKLFFIIAPIGLILDMALIILSVSVGEPDNTVFLILFLIQLATSTVYNAISSYGFIIEIAKIELMVHRRRVFSTAFGILSAI
jgi:hypothetical protein